jgi:hypothetical protein
VADYCYFSSLDGGWDSKGHVFTELSEGVDEDTHQGIIPGFVWWNANDKSAGSTFISAASKYCSATCTVYHMDVDAKGNIWFDFLGEAAGLGEVKNPTTNPSISVVFPEGMSGQPGGVYINDRTQILNLVDETSRMIYRYHLPVKTHSKPFQTLGPTDKDLWGEGQPDTGGFNRDDTKVALGDEFGWLDIGTVATNSWKVADKTSSP